MINRIAGLTAAGKPKSETRKAKPSSLGTQDVQKLVEPVQELIVNNPAAAMAAAFLVGVSLAWWIKRR